VSREDEHTRRFCEGIFRWSREEETTAQAPPVDDRDVELDGGAVLGRAGIARDHPPPGIEKGGRGGGCYRHLDENLEPFVKMAFDASQPQSEFGGGIFNRVFLEPSQVTFCPGMPASKAWAVFITRGVYPTTL